MAFWDQLDACLAPQIRARLTDEVRHDEPKIAKNVYYHLFVEMDIPPIKDVKHETL